MKQNKATGNPGIKQPRGPRAHPLWCRTWLRSCPVYVCLWGCHRCSQVWPSPTNHACLCHTLTHTMPALQVLSVALNELTGTIPSQLSKCADLYTLDLSNNDFR